MHLGLVAGMEAESFGEPGRRTFRIVAATAEGRVSLWLEKEQVVMLGSAITELLERVPVQRGNEPSTADEGSVVGDVNVKVGTLALGYDARNDGFTLEAGDFSSPFSFSSISLVATRGHLTHVSEQIYRIVAASRPRCPLCGSPLTGESHFCPESNGHTRLTGTE